VAVLQNNSESQLASRTGPAGLGGTNCVNAVLALLAREAAAAKVVASDVSDVISPSCRPKAPPSLPPCYLDRRLDIKLPNLTQAQGYSDGSTNRPRPCWAPNGMRPRSGLPTSRMRLLVWRRHPRMEPASI
jgi:hypothetical protein